MIRSSGRRFDELRNVSFTPGFIKTSDGSCLSKFGDTKVLCTANFEEKTPAFIKGTGQGWITAEYSLIPGSTSPRADRESAKGKPSGRTQEIQRIIGRSLRSVADLSAIGERQIRVDCDVMQADGGTRVASICGAYVALELAIQKFLRKGIIKRSPILNPIAAVSCGIVRGNVLLDLDYSEDSIAEADANFVLTGKNQLIEIQATGERRPFTQANLTEMLNLAFKAIPLITDLQKEAIS